VRQIHTSRRPETAEEQRYWRRGDRLRICGQLLVGLIGFLVGLIFLYALVYGGALMAWRS